MTIAELGSIGEFVSSILVLVTLVYLSVQVRYMKNQAKTEATYNRGQAGRDVLLAAANSTYISPIIAKITEHAGRPLNEIAKQFDLTHDESYRFHHYMWAWWRNQETYFGNVSAEEQDAIDRLITGQLATPGGLLFWETTKALMKASFVGHVDTLVPDAEEMINQWEDSRS